MILPAQTIREYCLSPPGGREPLVYPFVEGGIAEGCSYGLGPCGYDVRSRESVLLLPMVIRKVSTVEHFNVPTDLALRVCNKSTWLRCGLINFGEGEPGWDGYLTLELMLVHWRPIVIRPWTPVAQVQFTRLEAPTDKPYRGKYNHQPAHPVDAIFVMGE